VGKKFDLCKYRLFTCAAVRYQTKLSTDISYVSAAMMRRIVAVMTPRANAVQQVCSRNSFIVIRSHFKASFAFHGASRGIYIL